MHNTHTTSLDSLAQAVVNHNLEDCTQPFQVLLDAHAAPSNDHASYTTPTFAALLDNHDPLSKFVDMFVPTKLRANDEPQVINFTGNSLGLASYRAKEYAEKQFTRGCYGHNNHFEGLDAQYEFDGAAVDTPWMIYHEPFQELLATIVGCNPHEVIAKGTLSENNSDLLRRFYARCMKNGRTQIIIEEAPFPSDYYCIHGLLKLAHLEEDDDVLLEKYVTIVKKRDGIMHTEDILKAIDDAGDNFGMVFMGGVNYYTGQLLDKQAIVACAHNQGGFAGFDEAHGAGNVDLNLSLVGADFATGCGYKYLNGGPGACGWIYVNEKHHNDGLISAVLGRRGEDKLSRFNFDVNDPKLTKENEARGIRKFQQSNDPVANMVGLLAGIEIFNEAGMSQIRQKRIALTGYLEYLLGTLESQHTQINIITPEHTAERGSQLSLIIVTKTLSYLRTPKNNAVVIKKLFDNQYEVEREQRDNSLRVAPVPLINTYSEVVQFSEYLKSAIAEIEGMSDEEYRLLV